MQKGQRRAVSGIWAASGHLIVLSSASSSTRSNQPVRRVDDEEVQHHRRQQEADHGVDEVADPELAAVDLDRPGGEVRQAPKMPKMGVMMSFTREFTIAVKKAPR